MTQPSGPPSAAAGGSFRVDMEQAPEAIKELQSALEQLEDIKRDAEALGHVDPGSGDTVSAEAALLIGATAAGGPGSLVSAVEAGIAQMRQLIDSLRQDLASYQESDGQASDGLRRHGRA